MTKENATQYLPLVQALAEGKMIQIKMDNTWTDTKNVEFCMSVESYRIKPEPREWWIVTDATTCEAYTDKAIATQQYAQIATMIKQATIIHVKEVIE